MLEYIIKLPCEVLGHNMLGFLDLTDIIQFENAAASHESQQLLKSILPYSPPIVVMRGKRIDLKNESIEWINKKRCRVNFVRMNVGLLCDVDFTDYFLDNIELYMNRDISLQHIEPLKNPYIIQRVVSVNIQGDQDPTVMEVLFSLISNSSVRSLNSHSSNLSQWMEHLKKIGHCLCAFSLQRIFLSLEMFTKIMEYGPNLEKLSLDRLDSDGTDSNTLQSIANNCSHLRSLDIEVYYLSNTTADADLTTFAEKCPQLEELSLYCQQLTDQSVIALAQHCSRLKKLKFRFCKLTVTSLIALSERGLPLEELDIPGIPIRSAEIAAQCAHALSRVRLFTTSRYGSLVCCFSYMVKFLTGLRILHLWDTADHLLVPHLLLLLQGQCSNLDNLYIHPNSSITPQQLMELVLCCSKLHRLSIYQPTCISDAVVVQLARSCPHLQRVVLDIGNATEEGVLALAAHCRQLQVISISHITVTEETVRQLTQHCRHLIELYVRVIGERECRKLFKSEIKAIRGKA